jgi:exo-beta-1,3-glucanase (GH17 family)
MTGTSAIVGLCVDNYTVNNSSANTLTQHIRWPLSSSPISALRFYTYASTESKAWVNAALSSGRYQVLVGIDIFKEQQEQLSALAALPLVQRDRIMGVVIGNEYEIKDIPLVLQTIALARKVLPKTLVTTALKNSGDWFTTTWPVEKANLTDNAQMILAAVDVLSVNIYTCFSKDELVAQTGSVAGAVTAATSFQPKSVVVNTISAIRHAMGPEKRLWVTEIGWPTDGGDTDWSSLINAQRFYQSFRAYRAADAIFYFGARDVVDEHQYFGLFTADTTKFVSKFA